MEKPKLAVTVLLSFFGIYKTTACIIREHVDIVGNNILSCKLLCNSPSLDFVVSFLDAIQHFLILMFSLYYEHGAFEHCNVSYLLHLLFKYLSTFVMLSVSSKYTFSQQNFSLFLDVLPKSTYNGKCHQN